MLEDMNLFREKNLINLYHGSESIIKQPEYGKGNLFNDYGKGFYCTPHLNLAKEWSVGRDHDGYANKYELDLSDLNVLDLQKMDILYWVTILLENRDLHKTDTFIPGGYEYLVKHYHLDLSNYDVIVGYKADDSYFSYMRKFMSSALSIEQLCDVLKYGDLGLQYVLISKKAFSKIKFLGVSHVPKNIYLPKKNKRDTKARTDFQNLEINPNGIFLLNLLQAEQRGDSNENE